MLQAAERDTSNQSFRDDGQPDGSLKRAKAARTVRAPYSTRSSHNATSLPRTENSNSSRCREELLIQQRCNIFVTRRRFPCSNVQLIVNFEVLCTEAPTHTTSDSCINIAAFFLDDRITWWHPCSCCELCSLCRWLSDARLFLNDT
jgi:hypothetical protein